MKFKPSGVCAKEMSFDIIDNKIKNLNFVNGCPGNLIGLSKLIDGMDIDEVIEKVNKLYGKQMDTGKISKFCCDFKKLEEVADKYKNLN